MYKVRTHDAGSKEECTSSSPSERVRHPTDMCISIRNTHTWRAAYNVGYLYRSQTHAHPYKRAPHTHNQLETYRSQTAHLSGPNRMVWYQNSLATTASTVLLGPTAVARVAIAPGAGGHHATAESWMSGRVSASHALVCADARTIACNAVNSSLNGARQ